MRRARLFMMAVAAWAAGLTPTQAYYHYNHYTPEGIIQEKFDLAALPNQTLTFYVAGAANLEYSPYDSLPAILNQIREAALVWNSDISGLRVAFGGTTDPQAIPQTTPHGLVVFEDVPPGWVAYTTRTVADPVSTPEGSFVPTVQGVVHLNRNLASAGPSYMDSFFGTVVHEIGHVLGLQHTFTSSAMSTVTRATVRLKPVEADDVAALATLYPNRSAARSLGSITGRVTAGGLPVHMASVVALTAGGPAISALTGPDGTYRIDWLPPDHYWVYVHPLPPNPDMQLPRDAAGQEVPPSGPFATLFYPGTRDPAQFATIEVRHGGVVEGIDFSVEPRASVPIHDVTTYGWTGTNYATPAYANSTKPWDVLAAVGTGLVEGDAAALGLEVHALGNSTLVYAFQQYEGALALYLAFPQFAAKGPRHLLFTLPDDAYVLPYGVILADRPAPEITSVLPNPDGTATVTGRGVDENTWIYFDGVPATVQVPFNPAEQESSALVVPPNRPYPQAAAVVAYNSDNQTSLATQANKPPLYFYSGGDPPFVTITPNALPAGTSGIVEVHGVNTHFADGEVSLGFGTGDVHARQIWVLSPTHLMANITTSANAPAGILPVTVMSGFELAAQPFGFQVQTPDPQKPSVALPVVNADPDHHAVLYPGATAIVRGVNLALAPDSAAVSLNDQPAEVLSAAADQLVFRVPLEARIGPAVLRVYNGADSAFPVMIQIEKAPPLLHSVLPPEGLAFDESHPARAGGVLILLMSNVELPEPGTPPGIQIDVGGTKMTPMAAAPAEAGSSVLLVQAILKTTAPGSHVPVTVSVNGGPPSNPLYITVQ